MRKGSEYFNYGFALLEDSNVLQINKKQINFNGFWKR